MVVSQGNTWLQVQDCWAKVGQEGLAGIAGRAGMGSIGGWGLAGPLTGGKAGGHTCSYIKTCIGIA